MTQETQEIMERARQLSPVERAELLELLFDSFSIASDTEIDRAWGCEAEDRLEAYRSRDIDVMPVDEALKRINKVSLP